MNPYFNLKSYYDKRRSIESIMSAWTGHFDFAQWLVFELQPKTIVELGVDYGYSSLTFASLNIGHVYGIDCFDGSETAYNRTDTETFVRHKISEMQLKNITLIKSYFDEAAANWRTPIDILHIDGTHTYEAVKNDFETWSKFVPDNGIILMHDTVVPHFGVKDFYPEITWPKANFPQSSGLGIASRDLALIEKIKSTFSIS